MIFIKSFIFVGLISLMGQLILDNTKLTPGHITSLFVVLGNILSFLGIYDLFIEVFNIGTSIPITSFGNLLYKASLDGYSNYGFIGILSNILTTTSAGISSAIIFAILITMIFQTKD